MVLITLITLITLQSGLHGECQVQYVATASSISKAVSHLRDCGRRHTRTTDTAHAFRCAGDKVHQDFYSKYIVH